MKCFTKIRNKAMNVICRTALPSDTDAIMRIEEAAFLPGLREEKELYEKRIRAFPEGFLLAEDAETKEIGGYICSELWREDRPVCSETLALGHDPEEAHDYNGTQFYITSFGTLPSWRGRKVGSLLLDTLEKKIAENYPKATLSVLIVSEKWTAARRLYERRGFKEKGRIIDFFTPTGLPAEDAILMMKP